MKSRFLLSLLTASLVMAGYSPAADKVATVTEAVNQVSHGSSQSTDTAPAPTGTQLHDGEYLKTGSSSRAELQFSNKTVSRLGANTIFNYSASANQVDLQAGTILFSKPKDGQQLNIKSESVTAAIVGTTGFIHVGAHGSYLFGLVEGHANITIGGQTFQVGPGQVLVYTPGKAPQIFNYNVPQFLQTSLLITDFGPLPNDKYIKDEVRHYHDLVDRGFIAPPKDPYFVYGDNNFPPGFPVIGYNNAGNALNVLNAGRNTPPPSPTDDRCRPKRCCHPPCCGGGQSSSGSDAI